MLTLDELEHIDKIKSKMLKYIMFKKRTEKEVRQKFSDIDKNTLDNLIEELKEKEYINDYTYITRTVNEYMNLKNLSIKEISFKLQAKGIDKDLIDTYITQNIDILIRYEEQSAQNIYSKKINSMGKIEIKQYLMKKGYNGEGIKNLFDLN